MSVEWIDTWQELFVFSIGVGLLVVLGTLLLAELIVRLIWWMDR